MNSPNAPRSLAIARAILVASSVALLVITSTTVSADNTPDDRSVATEDDDRADASEDAGRQARQDIVLHITGIRFVQKSYVNVRLNSKKDKNQSMRLGDTQGIFDNCEARSEFCGKAIIKIKAVRPGTDYTLKVCHTARRGPNCAVNRRGKLTEPGIIRTIRPTENNAEFTVDLRDSYP